MIVTEHCIVVGLKLAAQIVAQFVGLKGRRNLSCGI